jgi:hypothetical protein
MGGRPEIPFEMAAGSLAGADSGTAFVVVVAAVPGLTAVEPKVPILVVPMAAVPGFIFFAPAVTPGALKGATVVPALEILFFVDGGFIRSWQN